MASYKDHPGVRAVCLVAILLALCVPACAVEFAGGTGTPDDPYQIATAEQLLSIGSDPNLYDKHFVLIADIDLAVVAWELSITLEADFCVTAVRRALAVARPEVFNTDQGSQFTSCPSEKPYPGGGVRPKATEPAVGCPMQVVHHDPTGPLFTARRGISAWR